MKSKRDQSFAVPWSSPDRRKRDARALSLSDLEIPVEPLLSRLEEREAGLRIRAALRRLEELLPRHPLGYRRYLARMGEVVMGGGLMFSWLSLRDSMADDYRRATAALERAESLAASRPQRAFEALEKGVAILKTYPLDPETLFHWCREVDRSSLPMGPLGEIEKVVKVRRLLRRALAVLDEQRDCLVLPNFRLVLKEVFRYHPTGMLRSDLFQEGVLGLHKAVFRFDPERATRFSTYATYWIRQAIRKALIDKSRMIRVPQAVQEELRKSEPSLSAEEAQRVRRIMTETMLFSAGETDDGNDRNSFVVPDDTPPEGGESLHTQVIPSVISSALEGLDVREREVLQRRFGLAGEHVQTLEEIGKMMNLSRERIRQIEREALERMSRSRDLQELYEDLSAVDPVGIARA